MVKMLLKYQGIHTWVLPINRHSHPLLYMCQKAKMQGLLCVRAKVVFTIVTMCETIKGHGFEEGNTRRVHLCMEWFVVYPCKTTHLVNYPLVLGTWVLALRPNHLKILMFSIFSYFLYFSWSDPKWYSILAPNNMGSSDSTLQIRTGSKTLNLTTPLILEDPLTHINKDGLPMTDAEAGSYSFPLSTHDP